MHNMDLEKLGNRIKEKRKSLGISLNKMSKDLYGTRGWVNYLSDIEKGNKDIQYTSLVKILNYLKIKTWKI
jgi:transcriptional regulator with XRE-family HTH domain